MIDEITQSRIRDVHPHMRPNDRKAAAGKSLLVYLFSGSLGLALLAFVLFKMIGW